MESLREKSRIHVTGNAGAGKSTLAQKLSHELNLPLYNLDAIVWRPGWEKTPPDERRTKEMEIAEQPKWIVDGVSPIFREHADVIIFLDVPRRVCVWRCAKRNLPYLFKSRPGLPDNCPEWKIAPTLLNIIWNFPRLAEKNIMADMGKCKSDKTTIHIKEKENPLAMIKPLL